ncbi:MAG: outer membrane protein transport protein [Gammaproteobacteria bacterium]
MALLLMPSVVYASFIESTMGTAVVNDATATYFNPAALTLLKNAQIIGLSTSAQSHGEFTGTVTKPNNMFSESGSSTSQTHYFLPSGYAGIPLSDKIFFGLAVVADSFNRDVDQNSVLRYVISDNNIKSIDMIPAIALRLNDYLSIGANVNFSQANFFSAPLSGGLSLDNPDIQSQNQTDANAWGGDVGLLLKPSASTLIGFNYRSAMTYHFTGTSQLEGNPVIVSNNFSFDYWTPARCVLSINQLLTRSFGMIGTLQWIKWNIFDEINANQVSTQVGNTPVILPHVTIPLDFQNAWVYTVGGYYHLSPKLTIRTAGSYIQSPGNPNVQVTEGDNIILGTSVGYKLNKVVSIDTSYSHAFIQNQSIDIQNPVNTINGVNKGYRDSVSLKITVNV